MDLYAHSLKEEELIEKYIKENYGEIPRYRGVRFMKVEQKETEEKGKQVKLFNKYAGTDTIYIHTRCGKCGRNFFNIKYSNYKYFGADKWEKSHKKLFLKSIDDSFDSTYCDHYFRAVINEDYENIIKYLSKENCNESN